MLASPPEQCCSDLSPPRKPCFVFLTPRTFFGRFPVVPGWISPGGVLCLQWSGALLSVLVHPEARSSVTQIGTVLNLTVLKEIS